LDGVVLLGLVKTHGHDHESPIIGLSRNESLIDWIDHAVIPFSHFLSDAEESLSKYFGRSAHLVISLKGKLDDIHYGITTSLTHRLGQDKYTVPVAAEAAELAGTRVIIAVGSSDQHSEPQFMDTPEEAIRRLDHYAAEFADADRVDIIPGPDLVFTNSAEMLKILKQWARDHGTLFHIHSSEDPATTAWFYGKYLASPLEYLHQAEALDEQTLLAHQVNNTPVDLEILQSTGAGVVHNPLANSILGSGMPPIIEMLKRGIRVAISTDGSGSADSQNMLAAARLASQYQKACHQDARLLPAQQVLEMVTVVPAKMLGINAGSLEEGKDADCVLIDLSRPNLTPTRVDNVVENLIWASDGSEVRWVIAGGRILKDDFRFLTLDEDRIKEQVLQLSELMIDYRGARPEIRATGVRQKQED
jgi:5-methylthioadenosine/S-adenosylhomocysteine deaminase